MAHGAPSAAGPMSDAYFLSRHELLSWINNLLHLNLSKVEQARSPLPRSPRMNVSLSYSLPKKHVLGAGMELLLIFCGTRVTLFACEKPLVYVSTPRSLLVVLCTARSSMHCTLALSP